MLSKKITKSKQERLNTAHHLVPAYKWLLETQDLWNSQLSVEEFHITNNWDYDIGTI